MARSGSVGIGRRATPVAVPALRRVITAEIAALATSLVLLAAQVRPLWAFLAAAAVALVPFATVRRRPIIDWFRVLWRFLANRFPDIGVTTDHDDLAGRSVGVHWQRNTVTCVIEMHPPQHVTTVLGRASADTPYSVPIETLASCLHQHDIVVSSIDITALGFRSSPGHAATEVYESLIGPLPAVATRTVWVAVTLDVRANARAVEARGGDRAGAARTAVVATTRVARALQAEGLNSRLLSSAELRSAVLHLCRGVGTDDLTQTWTTAPLPGVSSVGFGIDFSSTTAEDIALLWSTRSLGTTLTVHLEPTRDIGKLRVSGSCRFAARASVAKPPVRRMTSLSGSQRDGMFAQLPLAVPGLKFLSPNRTLDVSRLDALHLPVSGCGQLLGSDAAGHGVAMRLFGPGLVRVRIAGELYLAQQLLFRAIATGAKALVRTDRPHAWRSLVDSIGAPDRLSVDGHTIRSRASYDVVLIDFANESEPTDQQPLPGVTVVSLFEHVPRDDETERAPGLLRPQWDVSIVQPHASGDRIRVLSGQLDVELTLVTIPEETAFIGRPRSLRSAVRA